MVSFDLRVRSFRFFTLVFDPLFVGPTFLKVFPLVKLFPFAAAVSFRVALLCGLPHAHIPPQPPLGFFVQTPFGPCLASFPLYSSSFFLTSNCALPPTMWSRFFPPQRLRIFSHSDLPSPGPNDPLPSSLPFYPLSSPG